MDTNIVYGIYNSAIKILASHDAFSDKMEADGIYFEYGEGFLGKNLETLLNESQQIIMSALGLHESECRLCDNSYTDTFFIVAPDDNDMNFSMDHDSFYNALCIITQDEIAKDLFWKAIVHKDENSKIEFNNKYASEYVKIGIHDSSVE